MPYPIAHPAAVLPLIAPMGRWAVPSALVIGSIVPDLWYFVPLAAREASHSAAGLFLFCLPVGLVGYLMFHALLKQPLVALLPARLAPFGARGIPARPWAAVLLCLLVGAATHLAWDSFTHEEGWIVQAVPALQVQLFAIGAYPVRVYQLLQHASTLAGTGFVIWWAWRAYKRLPAAAGTEVFSLAARWSIIAALAAVSAGWAAMEATLPGSLEPIALRVGVLAYCVATTWLLGRSRAPRSPGDR